MATPHSQCAPSKTTPKGSSSISYQKVQTKTSVRKHSLFFHLEGLKHDVSSPLAVSALAPQTMGHWHGEPRCWWRDGLRKRTDFSVSFHPAVISYPAALKVLLHFRIFVTNQAPVSQNICGDREDRPGRSSTCKARRDSTRGFSEELRARISPAQTSQGTSTH